MATLQSIRSKGPLLVIVIGLALFAFIAGDAWKVLQPHQRNNDAGEINGKTITAQDYQKLVDEYTDIIKFSSGVSALNDQQSTQVKEEVWRSYVNNQLVEHEAQKLGLTVSKEEVEAMINEGTNPILQQTPFRNPQTGAFDKDMLKKVLVDYAKMDANTPAQYVEYYRSLNNFWKFIEKNLIQARLMEKYQTLIAKSLITNPIQAQATFDARVNQADILLAAVPYTSIPDSTVSVSESEIKGLYNKKKEEFKQYIETRNIKYIDVQVVPSKEDRADVEKEVTEYSEQLSTATDYANFVRTTGSTYPFADLYYSKAAYPTDVVARLDSASVGEVYGPYYNQADDSYNAFKILGKQSAADSIQFRQIQVVAETAAKTQALADSIVTAIKGGADFVEMAKKYSRDNANGASNWLATKSYEGANLDADNVKYLKAINELGVKEMANLNIGQANIILQVLDKKNNTEKYKVAVVKRPVEFSKETYNKAYNDFSQFIAANGSLDKLVQNAEENGYKLLERNDFYSSENMIGGIKGTKEALRWVFDAKPGDISPLYECGESDRLLVVGLSSIVPEGYRPMALVQDQLKAELIRDKKAEKLISEINAKNITSFDQCSTIANVQTDSVKHVSFAAPTYVSMTHSSEPVIGAYATTLDVNKVSVPIKGMGGVYVLQVYAKDKLNETFDATTEERSIEDMSARIIANRFINDLYLKANVKDNRYLFF